MNITRVRLAKTIAAKTGCTDVVALQQVANVFNALQEQFIKGNDVEIRGFGSFVQRVKKSRKARNIVENKDVFVPESRTVKFKPGLELKQAFKKLV